MKPNQAEDGDKIAKDGEVIKVPMMMMTDSSAPLTAAASQITDGVRHRPGFGAISNADRTTRQATCDAYEKRLTSAWKDPPPLATDKAPAKVAASDMYAAADAKLCERWRHV